MRNMERGPRRPMDSKKPGEHKEGDKPKQPSRDGVERSKCKNRIECPESKPGKEGYQAQDLNKGTPRPGTDQTGAGSQGSNQSDANQPKDSADQD